MGPNFNIDFLDVENGSTSRNKAEEAEEGEIRKSRRHRSKRSKRNNSSSSSSSSSSSGAAATAISYEKELQEFIKQTPLDGEYEKKMELFLLRVGKGAKEGKEKEEKDKK